MAEAYAVRGVYFESCNCDAICPCRTVAGVRGGRSTHGICYGALSWRIEEGRIGDVDVGGLSAALTYRYDDDEPGSPWTLVLHVDAAADERQRGALADLFLGRLGGAHVSGLPWVRKLSHVVEVRVAEIEVETDGIGRRLRVGDAVRIRAERPFLTSDTVACVVPGYDRPGTELVADELAVRDDPFAWELTGTCAFTADFAYVSGRTDECK